MIELDGRAPTVAELAALAVTGYGCYTTMLVRDGRVRGLPLHLHRLADDCHRLFDTALDTGLVRELAARAGTGPVVVRVGVVDPGFDRTHPGYPARPALLVTTRPAPTEVPPPVRLRSVRYSRDLAPVKHAGLVGALHQRALAQRAGFDDALFIDRAGRVAEGPTWGIGLLDGRRLVLPAGDALPGVTEALLRQVAADAGLSTVEDEVQLARLAAYPAAIVTSAVAGVRAVAAIDERVLDAEAPAIAALRKAYEALPGDPLLP